MPNTSSTGTITITATTGPGGTVTSKVITGVLTYRVDIANRMLYVNTQNCDPNGPALEFALGSTMTMTSTISSGNWTVVVSVS